MICLNDHDPGRGFWHYFNDLCPAIVIKTDFHDFAQPCEIQEAHLFSLFSTHNIKQHYEVCLRDRL